VGSARLIEACAATHHSVAPSIWCTIRRSSRNAAPKPIPCFALIARPNEQAVEALPLIMMGRTCSTYGAYSAASAEYELS